MQIIPQVIQVLFNSLFYEITLFPKPLLNFLFYAHMLLLSKAGKAECFRWASESNFSNKRFISILHIASTYAGGTGDKLRSLHFSSDAPIKLTV